MGRNYLAQHAINIKTTAQNNFFSTYLIEKHLYVCSLHHNWSKLLRGHGCLQDSNHAQVQRH